MNIVFLLLMLTCSLNATQYLLPHNHHEATHYIAKSITDSNSSIVIVSDLLKSREIKKAIVKALKDGIEVELITNNRETAAAFAIYKDLNPCLLQTSTLTYALIQTSNSSCLSTTTLALEQLRVNSGVVSCIDSNRIFDTIINTLKNECDLYLH